MYLLLLALFSATLFADTNLSHEMRNASLSCAIERLNDKAVAKHYNYEELKEELTCIDLLSQFELGRFLILRGGLNGSWTHYIVNHPCNGRITRLNSEGHRFNRLEAFLLDKAPTTLATQERYAIFKSEIQKRVKDGVTFLSVPCGVMGDLIDVDYSLAQNVSLQGIDIDEESLTEARSYAKAKGVDAIVSLSAQDAWKMDQKETFDLIASNGLTIYESDRSRVVELNQKFNDALKPGGCLVISFLTPTQEWNMDAVSIKDAALQKIVFSDILECKWQVFMTEAEFKKELEVVGFENIEVIYDKAHIFPTVIAYKKAAPTTETQP